MSVSEVGGFELRRVFAVAGAALRARWAPMLLFSLLLSFAPAMALHLVRGLAVENATSMEVRPPEVRDGANITARGSGAGHLAPAELFLDVGPPLWLWPALSLLCGVALKGALTSLTFSSVAGGRRPWRTAGRDLMVNLLPLLLIGLVSGLLVLLGTIVLVPGMIMFAAWRIAAPVQVAERLGIRGSLARSAQLTRGRRWLILGLVAVLLVGAVVVGVIASMLLAALWPAGVALDLAPSAVVTAATLAYDVVLAALYLELRRAKDGIGLGAVDEVFG